ncbi:serine/threonine-protein phosphatase 4 regulatory subunit 4-like isoform X1 [Periplaneta americana]|uniref:serine/threonine-protein phosphatase 4 regulatory subunit 4-like isoform X1 n=1 Tax=Periplaneta americana TaxID=6978 RepID=UPI0037E82ACF
MSWTSLQQEDNKSQAPIEAGEAPCEPVGEEVQRLSVIHSLPFLLSEDEPQCMHRVVPKVQQVLPNASAEFHLAASSTFLTILEKKLVHPRTFTQTFLQSILSSIDSRDPVVASAWLETLLDVIDLLPAAVIKSDILPVAISKGQISKPIGARLTACKLLGKMATKFEPYILKKEVLPLIHSLCQDVNYEVRACICSQLHYVARSLDAETVKPALLPSLVELARDEETYVRLAAVETIVNMIPNLQTDTLKYTIIPLVKKMCEQSLRDEDLVMVKISEQFGKLCLGLENLLTLQEKTWLLRHFQKMAELGLPQVMRTNVPDYNMMPDVVPANTDNHIACRKNCAFNFPAITMFCRTAGKADCFTQQLYPTFRDLACDPYFMIRRTIACGLNEIASVLGSSSTILKPELIKLLRDDAEEVLQGLVPRLGQTMVLLSKAGSFSPEFMDTTVLDVGRALLKCETEISMTTNWRLHAMILGQLECLPHCMPSDFIHSHFIPVIFNRIHVARPVPCRMAAARTMLVFLRYNIKQTQKSTIRSRIDTDLRNSDSCYKRMLFVKMCATAMDLFSRRYFKEYFFMSLIGLSDDRVPNIRLKLVTMLPKLKAMLSLPADRKLLTSLEACIRNLLLLEKDRDVMAQLRITIQALDAIEVRMDVSGTVPATTKEDIEDQKKAEEEAKLCAGIVPAGKRKAAGNQMDMKGRTTDYRSTISDRKTYSNIPTSSTLKTVGPRQPATSFGSTQHKGPMSSWQFAVPTNSISQQAQHTYICLAKHDVMDCCAHSHLEFPHHLPPTNDHGFCECVAGTKEMHLQTLNLLHNNLLASTDLSQLKSNTIASNGDCATLRDVYDAEREGTNLHEFGDKQPASLLKLEYKVYALGGSPNAHHGHWQYHRFNPGTTHSLDPNHSESSTKFIVSSLEDEFYVDAGIRIPQQLAASDFTPLPSRIPNLREILFKNRNTPATINADSQNITQPVSLKDLNTERSDSSESVSDNAEQKPSFSTTQKVVTKTSNTTTISKSTVSVNVTSKKTFIPSNVNKRNSGVFGTKNDYQNQPITKGKMNMANKQKTSVTSAVTNRRHSYMEGDKSIKVKPCEGNEGKKNSVTSENRRHSYLERMQVSTDDGSEKNNENFTMRKGNGRNQNPSEGKLSGTSVTNRRHSYNSVVQSTRGDTDIPVIKRGAASNRHSIGPEPRKSLVNSQSQMKRGTSLDRETGTDVSVIGTTVKRRSLITPSTVKHTVRRHSSLERDDMDRLSVRARVQGKKVENKFLSTNVQKELMMFSAQSCKTVTENNKSECSRNPQRDFRSLDDVGTSCKGSHTSKIPRGGGTSCHSSPGNSRASSPTILICGSSSRLRQRTAPNSRATSPTGTEKLHQRLSLGSLNCYMSNLKLAEPGTSRLPVRNFSRPQ